MILKSLQIMQCEFQADLATIPNADDGQYAFCKDAQTFFRFQAATSTWLTSDRTLVKKSSVSVNGKAVGVTKIYTMEPSTLKFYPFMVIMRAVNISGVTLRPTVSIGTNATAYDNIATASLLNTLLNTIGATGGSPQPASTSYPISGGTDIYANVSIAGIATNYTFTIEIIGFYD